MHLNLLLAFAFGKEGYGCCWHVEHPSWSSAKHLHSNRIFKAIVVFSMLCCIEQGTLKAFGVRNTLTEQFNITCHF